MTTRITVTTGDGDLLERNAQQQAANRQGALVKGGAEQAADEGAEQQRQRRSAEGLDPTTGRPLPSAGSTSRLTRIDQEPAAFRSGQDNILLHFKSAPSLQTIDFTPPGLPLGLSNYWTGNEFFTAPVLRKNRAIPYTHTLISRKIDNISTLTYQQNGGPYGEGSVSLTGFTGFNIPAWATDSQVPFIVSSNQLTFEFDIKLPANDDTQINSTIYLDDDNDDGIAEIIVTIQRSLPGSGVSTLILSVSTEDSNVYSNTEIATATLVPIENAWSRMALSVSQSAWQFTRNGSVLASGQVNGTLLYAATKIRISNVFSGPASLSLCAVRFTPKALYSGPHSTRSLVR